MKPKRYPGFFRVLFFLTASFTLSAETEEIIEKIAHYNVYEARYIGEAAIISQQYLNYEELKSSASREELNMLLSHKNSVVRLYAAQALSERREPFVNWSAIAEDALYETEETAIFAGCTFAVIYTGDIMLEIALKHLSVKEKEELFQIGWAKESQLYTIRRYFNNGNKILTETSSV